MQGRACHVQRGIFTLHTDPGWAERRMNHPDTAGSFWFGNGTVRCGGIIMFCVLREGKKNMWEKFFENMESVLIVKYNTNRNTSYRRCYLTVMMLIVIFI